MKLRIGLVGKLTIALTLGTTLVLVAYGALAVRRELGLFERYQREYDVVLGRALAMQVARSWRASGKKEAVKRLERFEAGDRDIEVRWIPLDAGSGGEHAAELSGAELAALGAGDILTRIERPSSAGTSSLHTYIPVLLDDERAGAVEIIESFVDQALFTGASIRRLVVALVACIVASALIAGVASLWLVGRPIDRLIDKAKQVGRGELDGQLHVYGADELGRLAEAMRDMSAQLTRARDELQQEEIARREAEEALRHAERLTTVGKLAAGVAHELGTPLNVISGRAKRLLRKAADAAEIAKSARIIGEQADRITHIVRQLLDFARRKGPVKRPIDAADLLRGTSELLASTVRKHHAVELATVEPAPGLVVAVDAVQLQQVLANLVLNAAQAMPNGGLVAVAAERYDGDPPYACSGSATRWVRIDVRDSGVGIRSDDLPRIFEPFFTTKAIGEGTGLGLSVVHGIVQEHGGWIDVESELGAGTCFSVYLPRVAEDVRAA